MLKNSVIQITTGKLVGASLIPSSVLLVSGIIIWQIWRKKQTRLQSETNELNDELKLIKQQMAELQTAKSTTNPNVETPSSSTPQHGSQKDNKSLEKMGLFEYLIEDNIQLRQQAS